MEKVSLREVIGKVMHQREDSLAIIDLGDAATRGLECFEFMGVSSPLPPIGPRII
jgi:hypothetical protein